MAINPRDTFIDACVWHGPLVSARARRGRGDVLEAFDRRGVATCARNDAERAKAIAQGHPELLRQLIEDGGTVLSEFAGRALRGGRWLFRDSAEQHGAPGGGLAARRLRRWMAGVERRSR